MENTTNLKKKKPLFEKMARLFFTLYMITLYIFVDKVETVGISRGAFLLYAGFTALTILQRKRLHIGRNMLVGYFAITWMYATTFWAYNEYWASYKMNTVWQVFLLFFLTYNLFVEEDDAKEYLLKSLYFSGISLLAYSIYTYGFAQVIEMMSSPGGVRLGREINHENTFGMYNATTVLISFYYILYKKRFKLIHIGLAVLAFIFTMSSGSRKALLMLCVGVLFMVYKKYGVKKLYKVIIIATLLIALFLMVIKLPMFELINTRLELAMETLGGDGEGEASANTRFKMILDGWDVFKERILIGYGADNYAVVTGHGTYSHNNFIEILVDFGLIGFVLYYMSYAFAMNNLLRSKNDADKALSAIFLVRLLMEVALVTYYSKQQWILLAFFLISEGVKKPSDKMEEIEEETKEKPVHTIKETIKEFMQEEKEGFYEREGDHSETEESVYEPETIVTSPSVEGICCASVFGQDISQDEVLGNNGEETRP